MANQGTKSNASTIDRIPIEYYRTRCFLGVAAAALIVVLVLGIVISSKSVSGREISTMFITAASSCVFIFYMIIDPTYKPDPKGRLKLINIGASLVISVAVGVIGNFVYAILTK